MVDAGRGLCSARDLPIFLAWLDSLVQLVKEVVKLDNAGASCTT